MGGHTRSRVPGVALVGCGYWGKNIGRNLHQLGALKCVYDPDPGARARIRELLPGVPQARSYARVLGDSQIQAVAIAAPAVDHYRLAGQALRAGRDVFVEKPLSLRLPEAEELVALAADRKRVLMVGHILHYHAAILKLKELIDGGELGELHYVYSNRLNLGRVRKEENILWSFAPHDISVMLLLFGAVPIWATTTGQHFLQDDVADVTMTCLGFPGKGRGHVFVSWLHPFKEQKLVVVGSRRMAVFDDVVREGKLRLYDKGIEWRDGQPVIRQTSESTLFFPETEPLREELSHFLDCIRSRSRPRTDGANGVQVLRVLDACQRSIEQGGSPVTL